MFYNNIIFLDFKCQNDYDGCGLSTSAAFTQKSMVIFLGISEVWNEILGIVF